MCGDSTDEIFALQIASFNISVESYSILIEIITD
jgi:hypothetical protein